MRFITVAIHTYEKALALRSLLESEGIEVEFRNVNIEHPVISSGVRVRIHEKDLPLALRIIENREIFAEPIAPARQSDNSHPILVPVDFSRRSMLAAMTAFHIAHRHGCPIMLLHTYIDPYVSGALQLTPSLTYELPDSEARVNIAEAARTQMKLFAQKIKDAIKSGDIPAVHFDTCVLEGVPEDAINDYAKAETPFMIVMGTRGREQKAAELIGSVTSEVLDKCRHTVLAIPEHALEANFKAAFAPQPRSILFLGNADQEDILAMDTLHRIFGSASPTVTIARIPGARRHIIGDPQKTLEALRDYCAAHFSQATFTTAQISMEKIIEDFASLDDSRHFDLIVIPNKKKNILSRLFNPTVAHQILFAVDAPLLVIPT